MSFSANRKYFRGSGRKNRGPVGLDIAKDLQLVQKSHAVSASVPKHCSDDRGFCGGAAVHVSDSAARRQNKEGKGMIV
jgi:hypothetical protein